MQLVLLGKTELEKTVILKTKANILLWIET